MANDVYKNIGFPISREEHQKREKVKEYLEITYNEGKNITEKQFQMLLLDVLLSDINNKDSSTKPK